MSEQQFSDNEKELIRKIAIALEQELSEECKRVEGLDKFARHPQLLEAIKLAKAKEIAAPSSLLDLTPWIFWSPLEEWFHSSSGNACALVFKFSSAIKGFPYEEMKDDGLA